MQAPPRPGRGWTAFSLIGIALWIGATVLVTVVNNDPSDGKPTLVTFITGGALFFGLMFAFALIEQLRRPTDTPTAKFGKRVAIGYTLAGIIVTGLGLAGMWVGGVSDGDERLFYYPLVAIVVLWAGVALWLLRHYRQG